MLLKHINYACRKGKQTLKKVNNAQNPGGGTPHMKGVGMLVGNFELNPKKRPCQDRQYIYFYIFSRATLNETFTAKYDGVLPKTP